MNMCDMSPAAKATLANIGNFEANQPCLTSGRRGGWKWRLVLWEVCELEKAIELGG